MLENTPIDRQFASDVSGIRAATMEAVRELAGMRAALEAIARQAPEVPDPAPSATGAIGEAFPGPFEYQAMVQQRPGSEWATYGPYPDERCAGLLDDPRFHRAVIRSRPTTTWGVHATIEPTQEARAKRWQFVDGRNYVEGK